MASCTDFNVQMQKVYKKLRSVEPASIETAEKPNEVIFSEEKSGKFVPRSIHVDSEPSVIDQIRKGPFKDLFDRKRLISGKESAADNYGTVLSFLKS